jgi:transcription elongation factor GreA
VRQDVLDNRVSNQSPFGKAMLGKAVGERVYIPVNDGYGYYVVIRAIEKGQDDGSIPINEF